MSNADEAKLISRAKNGEESAVAELYRTHVQAIYRFIFYRVGDQSVAEDLTSDTFLKAIESLERYEYRGVPFRAWLYRIAYTRVADYHRTRYRRTYQPLDTVELPVDADLEGRVARHQRIEEMAELLPLLTDDRRVILRILAKRIIVTTQWAWFDLVPTSPIRK